MKKKKTADARAPAVLRSLFILTSQEVFRVYVIINNHAKISACNKLQFTAYFVQSVYYSAALLWTWLFDSVGIM